MNSGEFSPKSAYLQDVERILGGVAIPATRETLEYLVETPLLAACQEFYDKNIRTIVSSANIHDVSRGFAYINIDCNTLSEENRKIADSFEMSTFKAANTDGSVLEVGCLAFPVTQTTTAEELSDTALGVARQFKMQPMLWAPVYELADIRIQNPGMEDAVLISKLMENGYYIDSVGQKVYLSKEHFRKCKQL